MPEVTRDQVRQEFAVNSDEETYSPITPTRAVTPDGDPAPSLDSGHPGHVIAAGRTPRLVASMIRPGQALAYAPGDIIANSQTASLVVPLAFAVGRTSGRLSGLRAVVSAASGALVTTLLDFDVMLFRPATNIPFAAAGFPKDNDPLVLTAAIMEQVVGIFSFTASGWNVKGQANSGYQSVALNSTRPYAPFNIEGLGSTTLPGIVMANSAWNPGNIAQTFSFMADGDLD